MADFILFGVFPYVAFILALVGGVYRYVDDRFSFSSFSSQFFENRQLFWGSVPWHYGILILLIGHLLAALFPGAWSIFFGKPLRLYILEVTGLALGFLTFLGIGLLIVRRIINPRVRTITTVLDWVLLIDLLLQVITGGYIALFYRWGSSWYLYTAVPWLRSLAWLDPQVHYIDPLPWIVKVHLFNAFVLIVLIPFTRLIHLFPIPIAYLWRPPEKVIWNRRAFESMDKKSSSQIERGF